MGMTRRWRLVVWTAGGALLAATLIAFALVMDFLAFYREPVNLASGTVEVYTIEPGSSVAEVASELDARGVIDQPLYLRIAARATGVARRIQAGEYEIAGHTTPAQLLAKFEAGDVKRYSLTIIEGWTFDRMVEEVRSKDAIKHQITDSKPAQIMKRLGHPDQHPEGRFFPDTYTFTRGTSDRALLQRAYRRMEDVLARAWQQRASDLPLDSAYEALILASIIERETAIPSERRRIAGVFVERLERGMRLQTDPTVIYGLGDDFQGDLTYEHLRRDTPYNTYTRSGLPPTPIALPSQASIEAAVDPERRGELYFVATGDGGHVFSKTHKAHRKAVRKYQLRRDNGTDEQ